MIVLTLVLISLYLIYFYLRKSLNYWNERNVPNSNPKTPLGDLLSCILKRKYVYHVFNDMYNRFKRQGHKYFGFYFTIGPVFIPIELDLIKRILVQDYNYFHDRGIEYDAQKIPLSENMFTAKQEKWKYLKEKFVSALTSNKLRSAIPIVEHYVNEFCKCIDRNIDDTIDILNLLQRYTVDFSCSYYLGLDEKNIAENKSPVMKFAEQINSTTYPYLLKTFLMYGTKNPANLFISLVINSDLYKFLHDYTKHAFNVRKQTKIERKDVLNDLIEQHENDKENFDFHSVINQVYVYFTGTIETSSSNISYVLYEIAKHPPFQSRLKEEIKEAYEKNGNLTFDVINDLVFLDNFITETFRMHPVFAAINRLCVKDYEVPNSNLVIEKGTNVVIPMMAVHMDSEYFDKPEEFNPDRYVDVTLKQNVNPFGLGQKQCPGKRVAMILIKSLIVALLKDYKITLNPKTGPKLENYVFTKHLLYKYKNTIWLNFQKEPLL